MHTKNILVGIVLVGVVGGGYYFFLAPKRSQLQAPAPTTQPLTNQETQPNSDNQVTTQKFTNTKYGYSFSYPAGWEVQGKPTDDFISIGLAGQEAGEVVISVSNMVFDDRGEVPFAEYVKTAGTSEIQNYTKLATIKQVTTNSGTVGYQTTWEVAPPPGVKGVASVSDPMTYFPLSKKYGSGMLTKRLLISLENDNPKIQKTYEDIIASLTFVE